jgi:hypothetical protein
MSQIDKLYQGIVGAASSSKHERFLPSKKTRAARHKDLEFAVSKEKTSQEKIFKTFEDACAHAVAMAVSNGENYVVDVLCWSKAAARAWGGDYGVEQYNEDPEASVSERIVIKAESLGRIA